MRIGLDVASETGNEVYFIFLDIALFEKMNQQDGDVVETQNPVSQEHGVCRNWLVPSLMETLEFNRNREYPQKIFEVGDVLDEKGGKSRIFGTTIAAYSPASEARGSAR